MANTRTTGKVKGVVKRGKLNFRFKKEVRAGILEINTIRYLRQGFPKWRNKNRGS